MPTGPDATQERRRRPTNPRYIEGQRILVEAIRYLVRSDGEYNFAAVEFLSEHFRTKFRMSDKPLVMMKPRGNRPADFR